MIIQLTDWLYQGNWESVRDAEYTQFPIGAIICVNENNERVHPLPGNDVNYLWCSFNDPGETLDGAKLDVMRFFARAFKYKGVLVHCYGGANRSSAICAFLLATIDFPYSPSSSCQIVRQKNPFMGIREELEQRIFSLTGFRIGNPRE